MMLGAMLKEKITSENLIRTDFHSLPQMKDIEVISVCNSGFIVS